MIDLKQMGPAYFRQAQTQEKTFEGYDKQGSNNHTLNFGLRPGSLFFQALWNLYSYGGGMVLALFWLVMHLVLQALEAWYSTSIFAQGSNVGSMKPSQQGANGL